MKQKTGFRIGAVLLVFFLLLCGCTQNGNRPGASLVQQGTPIPTAHFSLIEEDSDAEGTSVLEDIAAPGQEGGPILSASPTPDPTARPTFTPKPKPTESPVREDGLYFERDEVALYLHLFGHLPDNYITKKEARILGWIGGSLDEYAYGKCIGGDYFGNYEGLLPEKRGRKYYECDIGTLHKRSRGAKRIIYSNDGLIYYTEDHFESYTLLYGEE